MRQRHHPTRGALAAAFVAALAASAAAQTGRIGGTVKDEAGQPIKGATVTAENPGASPSSFTATTDDKGRFSIIGLRSGAWTFSAQAPGFAPESGRLNVSTIGAPNPPLTFTLKKGGPSAPAGALGGLAAKDLQAELALADQAYNTKQWDDAVAKYQAILAKAPSLTAINLQIAQVYRAKADDMKRQDPKANVSPVYDQAIATYESVLKADPANDKAKIGIGMTNLEKGDLDGAEKTLQAAAQGGGATREVFYNLGEVLFAKSKTDEASAAYNRAAQMDPRWGKPVFALGKVALNKGDTKGAIEYFNKVVEVDPMSPEAVQAKAIVEQLKK
jgi:tetratricopeptide (TPR) repeat protein